MKASAERSWFRIWWQGSIVLGVASYPKATNHLDAHPLVGLLVSIAIMAAWAGFVIAVAMVAVRRHAKTTTHEARRPSGDPIDS